MAESRWATDCGKKYLLARWIPHFHRPYKWSRAPVCVNFAAVLCREPELRTHGPLCVSMSPAREQANDFQATHTHTRIHLSSVINNRVTSCNIKSLKLLSSFSILNWCICTTYVLFETLSTLLWVARERGLPGNSLLSQSESKWFRLHISVPPWVRLTRSRTLLHKHEGIWMSMFCKLKTSWRIVLVKYFSLAIKKGGTQCRNSGDKVEKKEANSGLLSVDKMNWWKLTCSI